MALVVEWNKKQSIANLLRFGFRCRLYCVFGFCVCVKVIRRGGNEVRERVKLYMQMRH